MIRLICLLTCLLPVPALAQTLRVLSGEHSTFTRLAMVMPGVESWAFGKTESGYDLSLSPSRIAFDTRGVFDRIPRSRLNEVLADPSGGRLSLVLGCDCHAIATEVRKGVLAIDVFDGPGPMVFASDLTLPERLQFESSPVDNLLRPRPRPGPRMAPEIPDFLRMGLWTGRTMPPDFAVNLGVGDSPAAYLDDSPFAAVLLKELSRATLTGVLEPTQDFQSGQGQRGLPLTAQYGDQVRIRLAGGRLALSTSDSDTCPEDDHFDLSTWVDSRPFTLQLSDLRSRLMQEFDRPDIETVLQIARLYIASGFGVEAINTLTMLAPESKERQWLTDMAQVVDGLTQTAVALHQFRACDTRIALWALLAYPEPDGADKIAYEAVIRAFSELPPHLRKEIGPRLVQILLRLDRHSAAENVRAALQRANSEPGPELTLVQARVAARAGQTGQAEALWQETSQSSGPLAPIALIELVDVLFERGVALDEKTLVLLESHAVAGRRSNLGSDLNRVLAKALLLNGEAGRAFSIGGEERAGLIGDLYRGLAAWGVQEDILLFGSAPEPLLRESIPTSVRQAMAQRFLDMGLPELAASWVAFPASDGGEVLPSVASQQAQDNLSVTSGARGPVVVPILVDGESQQDTAEELAAVSNEARVFPGLAEIASSPRAEPLIPLVSPEPPLLTPLARARRATDGAAATRVEIEQLLRDEPFDL